MQNSLLALCTAKQAAGTTVVGFTLFTYSRAVTHRADLRHGKHGGIGLTFFHQHGYDFRDHITGAAHDDRVTHTHVFATRFVFVVQGGVGHRHAADKHGGQFGNRCQFAGTAHLHFNRQHRGELFLRRVFMGYSPTRLAADKAQLLLQGQTVNLVDHTVDVIRQTVT